VGTDGTATPFITILASGDLRVKGTVSEQNIYDLSQGMSVIVRSRMDNTITWSGTISSIDTSQPETSDNYYYDSDSNSASNYAFYVTLEDTSGLMMGQHVTIEPDYGQEDAKSGIWLDAGWIVQGDDGTATVWKQGNNGKLTSQAVELGDYDEELDQYEITSGLSDADYIAWPDEDCKEGAATTQEMVWDDSDYDESDFFGDEDYDLSDYDDLSDDFFSEEETLDEDTDVSEAVG
jgi:HlyD family secretion protein